ncbi:MAG: helix-turn-helix domain-containing protein [Myxococcota bacterium]|nr:helix-turn-helix domain-containing protein [Myxococcota bacterium]
MSEIDAPQGKSRRRRSAGVAREEILSAAQRLLSHGGPDAIRLQDIARDVGISHPTILHHFGSRDGLIEALDARAIQALSDDVARILQSDQEPVPAELVERVAETMDQQGLARLVALWAMREPEDENRVDGTDPAALVADVSELIRSRLDAIEGVQPDRLEAISFRVRLAVFAMFGQALIGDALSPLNGADRTAERHRFRQWLSELLLENAAILSEDSRGD